MEIKKDQFISDLIVGTQVDSVFVIARKQVRQKKNGEDFCTISLQDREGAIDGVLWTEVFCKTEDFAEGDFISVKGDVREYKGKKQLIINSLTRLQGQEDQENLESQQKIDYSDYMKTTGKDIEEMYSEVKSYIANIKNSYLKKLIGMFFDDERFVKDFKDSTAAIKYHHACKGGLIEHSLAVIKICDGISRVYHNLNYDLLISGALLHDNGKIREYRTGVTSNVTNEGKLLGHITIGYGWVLENIKKITGFPADLQNRLLHIILSHHGHREFGSPKRPKILEAFIVYHVDHMDADIGGFNIVIDENRSGEDWSDYVKNFERAVFLKKLEIEGDNNAAIDETSKKINGRKENRPPQNELF